MNKLLPFCALAALTATGCARSRPRPAQPSAPTRAAIDRPAGGAAEAAQRAWCEALVAIGKADANNEDARALAAKVLASACDYATVTVLFKPTLTHGKHTFRRDTLGALAYFVGGDASYPDGHRVRAQHVGALPAGDRGDGDRSRPRHRDGQREPLRRQGPDGHGRQDVRIPA